MRYEIKGNETIVYDAKGNTFLIDTNQIDRISVCNWYVDNKGYVRTASRKYNRIYLHRFLMGVNDTIDHINRIKTDNRLCNLRVCTIEENNRNRKYLHTKTGVQGVSEVLKNGKRMYRARIGIHGKRVSLGYYDSIDEARQVREEAERELNF